tara:strand:- start:516 stop:839 length:324 start_codon:yes stop_codon:yes gene_type:complete
MRTEFKAKGMVIGNYWGGGKGGYPARQITSDTKEQLFKDIDNALKNGSLDSGMGYESLIGAVMEIETTEYITENNKEYSKKDYELKSFGNLTDDEYYFLEELTKYTL